MAVNTKKLLSPAKESSLSTIKAEKFLSLKSSFIYSRLESEKDSDINDDEDLKKELLIIKSKVIEIDKLLKSTFSLRKKNSEIERRRIENENREQKEKKLENQENKNKDISKISKVTPPKLGFLEWLKRFVTGIIAGFLFTHLFKHLPLLIGFVKLISPVAKFFEFLTGKFFETIINFIDIGYTAQETVRNGLKKIGGEPFAKAFDAFNSALTTFINTAIIVAIAASSGTDFGLGKGSAGENARGPKGRGPMGRRPFRGVTEGRGGRTPGFFDRFRSGPRITGGQPGVFDKLRGIKDKITDPFRLRDKVTGTETRKPGIFDSLTKKKDEILEQLGLKKPKVTGGSPTLIERVGAPFRRKPKVTGTAPSNIFEFIGEGLRKTGKAITGVYDKTVGAIKGKLDDLVKGGLKNASSFLEKQPGVIGKLGKQLPKFLQKVGKYIPFVGDAVGLIIDIARGVDWRRALLRAIVGVGIDAGFTALMGALGLAAPFTGGASGALATAIYATYMTADIASGGFGRILGDKIADAFKIPQEGGDTSSPPAQIGSQKDVSNLEKELRAKAETDPKFKEKLNQLESQKNKTQKTTQVSNVETQSASGGGLIKPLHHSDTQGITTRGGEVVGGAVKRSIKVAKKPRKLPIKQIGKGLPGRDIGGKYKIEKLFPNPNDINKPNPLRSLETTSKYLKEIPFLGSLMGASIDIALGQKPDSNLYNFIGATFGNFVQTILATKEETTNNKIIDAALTMNEGGLVEADQMQKIDLNQFDPEKVSNFVIRSFSPLLNAKLGFIFKDITKEISGSSATSAADLDSKESSENLDLNKEGETSTQGTAGKGGVINPVPSEDIAKNKGGYAADTGLDILSPVGKNVVATANGILEYAERGHVAQMGQDANPNMPGMQDQHSVRIKLDKPFNYAGKPVNFFYATHMYELNNAVKNKSNIPIKAGTVLGKIGVANNVSHTHVGYVGDRNQNTFLNFKEVKNLLSSAVGGGLISSAAAGGKIEKSPSDTKKEDKINMGMDIWREQKQSKFFKDADQTGMNIWNLKYSDTLAKPKEKKSNINSTSYSSFGKDSYVTSMIPQIYSSVSESIMPAPKKSNELSNMEKWAQANRKMIESVGTKKQREILLELDKKQNKSSELMSSIDTKKEDKIKMGMGIWNTQRKSQDYKEADKTGMNIWNMLYSGTLSKLQGGGFVKSSSANSSTGQKINSAMEIWNKMKNNKDYRNADAIGKDIWNLKYKNTLAKEITPKKLEEKSHEECKKLSPEMLSKKLSDLSGLTQQASYENMSSQTMVFIQPIKELVEIPQNSGSIFGY